MPEPAYVIAQIAVKDLHEYLTTYGKPTVALIEALGGEFLVASGDADVLEGEWSGNWTVVIRFPSREVALEWYESPEYAPLRALRMHSLTDGGNLALVPGRAASSSS